MKQVLNSSRLHASPSAILQDSTALYRYVLCENWCDAPLAMRMCYALLYSTSIAASLRDDRYLRGRMAGPGLTINMRDLITMTIFKNNFDSKSFGAK
eukprot:3363910-Rhodomonas_salina.1